MQPAHWSGDVDTLAEMVVKTARRRSHLVMSSGGFGGIHRNCWMGWRKTQERNSVLNIYAVSQLCGWLFYQASCHRRIPLAGRR